MVLVSATSDHGAKELEHLAAAVAVQLAEDARQDLRSLVSLVEVFPGDDAPFVKPIALGKPFAVFSQRIAHRPFADSLALAMMGVNPVRELLILASGIGAGFALFRFEYPREVLDARVQAFQDALA